MTSALLPRHCQDIRALLGAGWKPCCLSEGGPQTHGPSDPVWNGTARPPLPGAHPHLLWKSSQAEPSAESSSSPRSSQPPSPEPVVTMAPTVPPMEQSLSSSPAFTPPGPGDEEEEDDDLLSPHLLLSDSLSQLEEFGRQKKWRRKHHKQHRPRQFNDLWVRIEDSTTTAPSPSKATNAYDTAKPSVRFAKQLEHRPPPAPPEPPGPSRSSASVASPWTSFLLFTTGTILLQMVGPS